MKQNALIFIMAVIFLSCHSAIFQTAYIREGKFLTAGMVRNQADGEENLYDYSLFLRAEKGAAASHDLFGTSFGISALLPFNFTKETYPKSDDQPFSASTPNGDFGLFPQVKVQMMHRLPVDVAADLRFKYLVPERLSLLVSKDVMVRYTPYGALAFTFTGGVSMAAGAEIMINPAYTLYVEYSMWLTKFNYIEGYGNPPLQDRPFSLGLALTVNPNILLNNLKKDGQP